ncbi:MAG: hypothetical protein GY889_05010 [Proteobacteria bacterium]|nr:hypothetical protein [Pseudomonadota bacterium]
MNSVAVKMRREHNNQKVEQRSVCHEASIADVRPCIGDWGRASLLTGFGGSGRNSPEKTGIIDRGALGGDRI